MTHALGGFGAKSTESISRMSPEGSEQYSNGLSPRTGAPSAITSWVYPKNEAGVAVTASGARQSKAVAGDKSFMVSGWGKEKDSEG